MRTLVARKAVKKVAVKKAATSVKVKKISSFRPKVRSRHPSHSPLRTRLPLLPFRSVVRLGSTTIESDVVALGGNRIECNTVQAVKNSASKLLMKRCFTRAGVQTPDWFTITHLGGGYDIRVEKNPDMNISIAELPYPIVAKHIHGSRGTGNYKINNQAELRSWLRGKTLSNYIFERFYSYNREYRIHVTAAGYFYTCRKMLKRDADESNSWQRHDDNCVWIVEENPAFEKPVNFNRIVQDCVTALNAVGLDIGAFDVKVQSANDSKRVRRTNPEWIVIESCSAPSFGEITTVKYIEQIPIVLRRKYEGRRI